MAKEKIYFVRDKETFKVFTMVEEAENYAASKGNLAIKTFDNLEQLKLYDLSLRLGGAEGFAMSHEYIKEDSIIIWSDGSYSKELNSIGYGYVITRGSYTIFKKGGKVPYSDDYSANNILGECHAVLKALLYCAVKGLDKPNIIVAHDYIGVGSWIEGKWKTKTELAKRYYEEVISYKKDMEIHFCNIPGHSKEFIMNNEADKLAKNGLKMD
ncbi:RNase H family protein [Clostridium sp.]|uniref:RNase H family protein n=1 Tax=Clostridium sp. TaxID=1506 RepID=UPI001B6F6F43|nr:RNase H family protein [Clostridium sp.]MBP3915032.1 hypothetical protein [Clostridium sp.]